jgi:hypothetical protein
MDSKAIIESYVGDVMRHLPRRHRNDVGFELRSLLSEEVDGRAADAGRPADAAMTMELLGTFGRPAEVADRYRPAGFTIIRPTDAPRFAWLALGGVLLQWTLTLPAALLSPAPDSAPIEGWAYGADAWWGRLSLWWLSWGLGAFWWPGILVTFALLAAALNRHRQEVKSWRPSRVVDRDHVNSVGLILALSSWVAGATFLIALPGLAQWAPGLPQPLLGAFAFNQEFLVWRAPWVLPLWMVNFALYLVVLRAGRWNRTTRRIDLVLSLGWLVLMTWWLTSGPIFETKATDEAAKFGLVVIVLIVLIDTALTLRRNTQALRTPIT